MFRLYNRELSNSWRTLVSCVMYFCALKSFIQLNHYLFHDDCIIKASFLLIYPKKSTVHTPFSVKCTLYCAETIRFVYYKEIMKEWRWIPFPLLFTATHTAPKKHFHVWAPKSNVFSNDHVYFQEDVYFVWNMLLN